MDDVNTPTSSNLLRSSEITVSTHQKTTSAERLTIDRTPLAQTLAIIPFTASFPFSYVNRSREPQPAAAAPAADGPPTEGLSVTAEKKPATADKEHKKRSKNWTRNETLALIRLRSSLASRFGQAGRKTELWDEISSSLCRNSFLRDPQQCRDKWEKLMAGFKEVKDGVKRKEDYPYYDELLPLLSLRHSKRDREQASSSVAIEHLKRVPSSIALEQFALPTEPSPDEREVLRASSVDAHADEEQENSSRMDKRIKCDSHCLEEMVEALLAKQQRFFQDLLDTFEQKEQVRERIRQEREDKWRAEERALRCMFTEAMLILTHRLSGERASVPSCMAVIPAPPSPPQYSQHPLAPPPPPCVASPIVAIPAPLLHQSHPQPSVSPTLTSPPLYLANAIGALPTPLPIAALTTSASGQSVSTSTPMLVTSLGTSAPEYPPTVAPEPSHCVSALKCELPPTPHVPSISTLAPEHPLPTSAPEPSLQTLPAESPQISHNTTFSEPKRRSKNWKPSEVLTLIKLRSEMEGRFAKPVRRTGLWEEVADVLQSQGISRDAKQCREKWEKLTAELKGVRDGKKKTSDSPYFTEMAAAITEADPM